MTVSLDLEARLMRNSAVHSRLYQVLPGFVSRYIKTATSLPGIPLPIPPHTVRFAVISLALRSMNTHLVLISGRDNVNFSSRFWYMPDESPALNYTSNASVMLEDLGPLLDS